MFRGEYQNRSSKINNFDMTLRLLKMPQSEIYRLQTLTANVITIAKTGGKIREFHCASVNCQFRHLDLPLQ